MGRQEPHFTTDEIKMQQLSQPLLQLTKGGLGRKIILGIRVVLLIMWSVQALA
jgi:hypothetical protein